MENMDLFDKAIRVESEVDAEPDERFEASFPQRCGRLSVYLDDDMSIDRDVLVELVEEDVVTQARLDPEQARELGRWLLDAADRAEELV